MRGGVPKEIKNHEYRIGLTPAGVRELERVIGRLARKRARQVLEKHNGEPLPPITTTHKATPPT